MIDLNKRRISNLSVVDIKRFIELCPNCRVIFLKYKQDGSLHIVTFENETVSIEDNHLVTRLKDGFVDINDPSSDFKSHSFLVKNEEEFPIIIEIYRIKTIALRKKIVQTNDEINSLNEKLYELLKGC